MADDSPLPSASPAAETLAETPAELSLSDHEAQFGVKTRADRDAPPADADASARADDEPAAGERERGTDGKFLPQKRAKSAQATPADVPRIQELTRKLREREAELERLRQPPPRPAPPAAPPRQAAPPPQTTAPRLQQFIDSLRPDEDYNLAVERHAEAMAHWTITRREQQIAQQQAERQFAQTFAAKVADARDRYPDFEDVALNAPSAIPQGSLIDRWIWEHKTGADVLYYFQKHPDELPQVLALPPLDQLETLALLSQRVTSSSRGSAVATGSTATPVKSQVPRPPNPVRTGPMRGGDEPPGDDASLAAHEQFYYGSKRRRA